MYVNVYKCRHTHTHTHTHTHITLVKKEEDYITQKHTHKCITLTFNKIYY